MFSYQLPYNLEEGICQKKGCCQPLTFKKLWPNARILPLRPFAPHLIVIQNNFWSEIILAQTPL
jgi:hypothetical protein